MNRSESFAERRLKQWQLALYLIPVLGTLPALWSLSRPGDRPTHRVCRLSLLFALIWLLTYSLLNFSQGQVPSGVVGFRIMFLNGLLTSGYFLTCFTLMVNLARGKTPYLPGLSPIAEHQLGKHLPQRGSHSNSESVNN